jgi:hypothetical protein
MQKACKCKQINSITDFKSLLNEYKNPCERIISHIKKIDKSINPEKAFFHFIFQASLYYPNFNTLYCKIIENDHIHLISMLKEAKNNISNTDLHTIANLFLCISYSNAFNNAFSLSKKKNSLVSDFINLYKMTSKF